jgi:hypothetical protein
MPKGWSGILCGEIGKRHEIDFRMWMPSTAGLQLSQAHNAGDRFPLWNIDSIFVKSNFKKSAFFKIFDCFLGYSTGGTYEGAGKTNPLISSQEGKI